MQATLNMQDRPFGRLDVLQQHRNQCAVCRLRGERALQLADLRQREKPVLRSGRNQQLPANGIQYTALLTSFGTVWIARGPKGLVAVDSSADEPAFCHELERLWTRDVQYAPDALAGIAQQFQEYFAGDRRIFDVLIDLSEVPRFQRMVLEAVAQVPYGEVASYGEIARQLGMPSAARAVGTAVATNPLSIVIPCHRIVRSDGTPGEYALRSLGQCGRYYKLALLEMESRRRPE